MAAVHYLVMEDGPVCHTQNAALGTTERDEVTCKRCKAALESPGLMLSELAAGIAAMSYGARAALPPVPTQEQVLVLPRWNSIMVRLSRTSPSEARAMAAALAGDSASPDYLRRQTIFQGELKRMVDEEDPSFEYVRQVRELALQTIAQSELDAREGGYLLVAMMVAALATTERCRNDEQLARVLSHGWWVANAGAEQREQAL